MILAKEALIKGCFLECHSMVSGGDALELPMRLECGPFSEMAVRDLKVSAAISGSICELRGMMRWTISDRGWHLDQVDVGIFSVVNMSIFSRISELYLAVEAT
jgi:hypothetical protein